MRKLGLIAAMVLLAGSGAAEAKVLEIYAQAHGGGGTGRGIAGAQQDADFFQGAGGASYGAKIGAELFWVDGWIEHNQYYDGSLSGTWTQFMIGMDWDFPLGDAPKPGEKPKAFGQLGFAVGFGVGTGQQVDPPLDNSEITDKGFVGQISLGAEYRFTKVTAIGIDLPVTYGYLFKNEGASNDEGNQYQSINAMILAHLRFYIDVK